jgi:hypothetical protein
MKELNPMDGMKVRHVTSTTLLMQTTPTLYTSSTLPLMTKSTREEQMGIEGSTQDSRRLSEVVGSTPVTTPIRPGLVDYYTFPSVKMSTPIG